MIEINENNYEDQISVIKENLKELINTEDKSNLKSNYIKRINQLLSNNSLQILCSNIINKEYIKDMNYDDLCFIHDTLKNFFDNIQDTKDKIDIETFLEKGNRLNIKKLKEKFKKYGRDKDFPNFNFKRLKELIENPPISLKPQDNHTNEEIIYDPVIVRKYLYGIIQMVIDEMDLLILFTGNEGMGKSCACSQDMSLVYYLLKELNLINYDYNISEMWFNTVQSFNETEDKYFHEKFRILGLDEGNELNAQDWQDPSVKTFFQRLRRERYNQRIKFISIPQLVELLKGISITRSNFIFYMESTDDTMTATLNKGHCNYYIIPRNKIYSYFNKRNLYRDEIQTILINHLKDKNKGYKKLPNEILIKKFKRNYVWGFDKKEYAKQLKETNKTYSVEKGMRLTEYQSFLLFKFMPPLKEWGFDKNKRKLYKESYATLNKTMNAFNKIFNENPDKRYKYEKLLEDQVSKNEELLNS